jgi:hypothetical protein
VTATAMLPSSNLFSHVLAVVKAAAQDIVDSANGFGHNDFAVDADGNLVPRSTTITIQPRKGEGFDPFVQRLKDTRQWRENDMVQFVYNNGNLQLVRITRNPPRVNPN